MWPDWIVPADSYEQSVEQMKDAFMQQLKWMDENIVFELNVEDDFTEEDIKSAKANREKLSERLYNVAGQPTTTSSKGIKLKKGRKYLVN